MFQKSKLLQIFNEIIFFYYFFEKTIQIQTFNDIILKKYIKIKNGG